MTIVQLGLIDEAEKKYALHDYRGGLDYGPDHLLSGRFGDLPVIFTAPHATKQLRLNKETDEREVKEEDQGTGGLAEGLASSMQACFLTAAGDQQGDANTDKKDHPFKVKLGELVQEHDLRVLFDLHGMGDGTADKVKGRLGLGLGAHPTPASGFIAQAFQELGTGCGIKVKVGNAAFAAISDNNVTTTARREFGLYSVQIELAPELRFGEGNDQQRMQAFGLIAHVTMCVLAKLPLLDELTHAATMGDIAPVEGSPVLM